MHAMMLSHLDHQQVLWYRGGHEGHEAGLPSLLPRQHSRKLLGRVERRRQRDAGPARTPAAAAVGTRHQRREECRGCDGRSGCNHAKQAA